MRTRDNGLLKKYRDFFKSIENLFSFSQYRLSLLKETIEGYAPFAPQGQHATGNTQRATRNGQHATGNTQRVTGNRHSLFSDHACIPSKE